MEYDSILYRILSDVYNIGHPIYEAVNRIGVYKSHLSDLFRDLCDNYSWDENNIRDQLLDDIHILITPFIFNNESLNVFCLDDYDYCRCNAEFLSSYHYGIIVAVTYGKCRGGDARFFIDESIGENCIEK